MDRITLEPGKRGGRPCIRGLRISVYDVLAMLSSGMSQQEILEDFPELTQDHVLAVLSYAADREHQVFRSRCNDLVTVIASEARQYMHSFVFSQKSPDSSGPDSIG